MQNSPKSAPEEALEPKMAEQTAPEWQRLLSFAIIGGGGFIVHAGMLFGLFALGGVNPLLAWFPAFILAVLFTWLANRFIAFKGLKRASHKRAEAALYFLVQSMGAAINFIVYSALISWAVTGLSHPVIALAIGSIAAFGFNYAALRLCVYKNEPRA